MLNFLYLTGDLHGSIQRLLDFRPARPHETGLIVLGDAGANYYLNKKDDRFKTQLNNLGYKIYLLRGNHEARPEDIAGMEKIFDEDLLGEVFQQPQYPNIRYLLDGGIYVFKDKKILTIGGAYSVDKFYRLAQGWQWFPNEQLNAEERDQIFSQIKNHSFDFILSHTCPTSLQPTDLFLPTINQSLVDSSMEEWLEKIKNNIKWDYWLFGHYHQDRVIAERVFMLMHTVIDIEAIQEYNKTQEVPFGMRLSKQFSY